MDSWGEISSALDSISPSRCTGAPAPLFVVRKQLSCCLWRARPASQGRGRRIRPSKGCGTSQQTCSLLTMVTVDRDCRALVSLHVNPGSWFLSDADHSIQILRDGMSYSAGKFTGMTSHASFEISYYDFFHFGFRISDFGFRISDFGFINSKFQIPNPKFQITLQV